MLHAAVKTDNVPMIRQLLADKGDPNSLGDQGIPPIFLCESVGATDALLRAGAKIEYELGDSFDYPGTALHIAVECRRAGVAARLIQAGMDVNAINCHGRSPLHVANSVECVKLLLSYSTNVNLLDH